MFHPRYEWTPHSYDALAFDRLHRCADRGHRVDCVGALQPDVRLRDRARRRLRRVESHAPRALDGRPGPSSISAAILAISVRRLALRLFARALPPLSRQAVLAPPRRAERRLPAMASRCDRQVANGRTGSTPPLRHNQALTRLGPSGRCYRAAIQFSQRMGSISQSSVICAV